MQLTNFKMYDKEDGNPNSLYMMSDEGMDWYESRGLFDINKAKFMYDANGLIVSASYDIYDLVPLGFSVSEIEYDGDVNKLYGMIYDGKTIKEYVETKEEKIERLKIELEKLKYSAIQQLGHLKTAMDLELASDEEAVLFAKLKEYVTQLSSIKPVDMVKKTFSFPVKPE
ncbi:tail fiber assembly protein [Escherichia coli]|uniref:tail fiber assembly protein n=1 Tax=Escherichia coli TaxID=562 RepID=UPI002376F886|nr:hypothetical protein vBEcoMphAPEC6_01710 [Escherichia phage ph0011]